MDGRAGGRAERQTSGLIRRRTLYRGNEFTGWGCWSPFGFSFQASSSQSRRAGLSARPRIGNCSTFPKLRKQLSPQEMRSEQGNGDPRGRGAAGPASTRYLKQTRLSAAGICGLGPVAQRTAGRLRVPLSRGLFRTGLGPKQVAGAQPVREKGEAEPPPRAKRAIPSSESHPSCQAALRPREPAQRRERQTALSAPAYSCGPGNRGRNPSPFLCPAAHTGGRSIGPPSHRSAPCARPPASGALGRRSARRPRGSRGKASEGGGRGPNPPGAFHFALPGRRRTLGQSIVAQYTVPVTKPHNGGGWKSKMLEACILSL